MTNQPLKTRSFVDHFLCLLFGLILFFNLVWLPNVLATDCGSTTIPQAECQALIMLYNSTDGPNWLDYSSNNWNVTNTPCTTWAGITCESEHITGIDRNNQGLKNKLGSTPVPLDLTALSNLQLLDLSENQLESIPDLSDLTHLQLINLNKNQLKGFIPDFLSTLTDLQYLDLSDNQLSGFIPDAEILGLLTKLSDLYLDHNQLSGSIPDLSKLVTLQVLYLGDNPLEIGPIPKWLEKLTQLRTLGLSNSRRTGTIPEWLNNLTTLEYLQLDHNRLTDSIPDLGQLIKLKWLFLNNNRLTGTIPDLSPLIDLEILSLASNKLWGPIPDWLGDLSQLSYLSLRGNQLTGLIPNSLSNLSSHLIDLDLRYNMLIAQDKTLLKFLKEKNPAWEWTQTVPPTNIKTKMLSKNSVEISWTPILYTGDGGYYQVKYATVPNESYTPASGTTIDKNATNYIISNLLPDTTYYFVVETYTPPHDFNQDESISELSPPVPATTVTSPPLTPLPPTMNLTVAFGGDGYGQITTNPSGLDCNSRGQKCSYSYDTATWINLIAVPAFDSEFAGWGGYQSDCKDGEIFMNEPHYCIVYFKRLRFPLTVTIVGEGKVKSIPMGIECRSQCRYRFESQTQITLTTIPDTNWQFAKWQGDCDANGLVTIDTEKHCEAIFVAISHDDSSKVSTDSNSKLTNLNTPPICQDNNCSVTVTSQPNQAESKTTTSAIVPAISTNVLQPVTETSNITVNNVPQPTTEIINLADPNEGVELVPPLTVSPGFYDFGGITVESFSPAQVVTVTNPGKADLQLGQLTVSSNEFLLTETCSNQILSAGNCCTITIIFQPQLAGVKTAYLAIPIAKPQQSTVTVVTLTGKGNAIKEQNSFNGYTVYHPLERDPADLPLLVTFISPLTAVITPVGVKLNWEITPANSNQIAETHLWRAESVKGSCPQDISQYDKKTAIELENKPQLDYLGSNTACYGLQLIKYNGEVIWYITKAK